MMGNCSEFQCSATSVESLSSSFRTNLGVSNFNQNFEKNKFNMKILFTENLKSCKQMKIFFDFLRDDELLQTLALQKTQRGYYVNREAEALSRAEQGESSSSSQLRIEKIQKSPESVVGKGYGKALIPRSGRKPNLSVVIPARCVDDSQNSTIRVNLPPQPGSSKAKKSAIRALVPRPSSRNKSSGSDSERRQLLPPSKSPSCFEKEQKSRTPRPFSFTEALVSLSTKRTSSLPVTPLADSRVHATSLAQVAIFPTVSKPAGAVKLSRSLSLPTNGRKAILRSDSPGAFIRVRPMTPRHVDISVVNTPKGIITNDVGSDDEGEDIPEDEACCRICLCELSEEGETLKLECSCKGELALAHEDCAIKWFSIKGNKTCDVCKQEVQNLPVALLRLQTLHAPNAQTANGTQQLEIRFYRGWQHVPVLICMLAYFYFLVQLMVSNMGITALPVALAFAFSLGVISSATTSTMVDTNDIWLYVSFQLGWASLLAFIFYSWLHLNASIAFPLSTYGGPGIAICVNSLIEYLRWRSRAGANREENNNQTTQQPDMSINDTSQRSGRHRDGGNHGRSPGHPIHDLSGYDIESLTPEMNAALTLAPLEEPNF